MSKHKELGLIGAPYYYPQVRNHRNKKKHPIILSWGQANVTIRQASSNKGGCWRVHSLKYGVEHSKSFQTLELATVHALVALGQAAIQKDLTIRDMPISFFGAALRPSSESRLAFG